MANALVLSTKSQDSLVKYCSSILETKRRFTQFTDKLTAIDVAYACYKAKLAKDQQPVNAVDIQKLLPTNDISIPIIASQVDSVVAYLVDVFLSGHPIFPVVSDSRDKVMAEKFESIVDTHAVKGRYARQFQMVFKDAAKYNFCALEGRWDSSAEFSKSLLAEFQQFQGVHDNTLDSLAYYTKVRRLDPYNTVWDYRKLPADVADEGEYVGYVELMGRVELKRLLNKYSQDRIHMNVKKAISNKAGVSGSGDTVTGDNIAAAGKPITYVDKPQISQYIDSTAYAQGGTWLEWLEGQQAAQGIYPGYSNMYEVATLYARIIPSEHGIVTPEANTPQIWKLQIVNEQVLIYAQPEDTPYDRLPIQIGQSVEDGFGYQTRGIGEAQIPFQQAGSEMYNIRISSAKRSINDRGIYDATLIDPVDVNSPTPAAKIPVNNLKMGKTLKDAYMPIPFQDGSTVSAMQDLQQTLNMANMLFGINPFRQGQTVKGNRTLGEFQRIDNGADLRSRMIALMMEMQIFMPLKDIIKLNIIRNKDEIKALNFNTGQLQVAKPGDFLNTVIEFQVADGFTPKSKLADTQQLQIAFQALEQNPSLSAGYNMPDLFAHLMSLIGVKNISQYQYTPDDKRAIMAAAMPFLGEMLQQAGIDINQLQQHGGSAGNNPQGTNKSQQPIVPAHG